MRRQNRDRQPSVSSKFQNEFAPRITAWLKERDRIPRKKAPQQVNTTGGKAAATKEDSIGEAKTELEY
jgi:hypothetical protein